MRLLAISGSLRSASSNTVLLKAVTQVKVASVEVTLSEAIGQLPLYNPDLEADPPDSVLAWREELASYDGFIVSTPEYAHALPGAFKNGLDWIVRSGEFMNKPFCHFIATPPTPYATAQLVETLGVMMGIHVPEADATFPLRGKSPDGEPLRPEAILANPDYVGLMTKSLSAMETAWRNSVPVDG